MFEKVDQTAHDNQLRALLLQGERARVANAVAERIRRREMKSWRLVLGTGPFRKRVYRRNPFTGNLVRIKVEDV